MTRRLPVIGKTTQWLEVGDDPITFDQAEAHCELGGWAVAIHPDRPDEVFAYFAPRSGPMFPALWDEVTFYLAEGGPFDAEN